MCTLHHICIKGLQASGTTQNTNKTYLRIAGTQTLSLAVEKVPLSAFCSACTMLLTAYLKDKTDHKASQSSTDTSLMACSVPLSR